ncbi:MAG TPA: hypothetical protein VGQ55_03725 [Pyrinomonadaceae bacterium]|jgi:hypothetical protein|nr:hypothetical protein [Pyrinomonadaceae bacterium]
MNDQTNNTDENSIGEQRVLPLDPPLDERASITNLTAENERLKASIRLRDARDALTAELKEAGARSPGLLFEAAKNNLQLSENGDVQNVEAIVAMLKHDFPEQFGRPPAESIDAGAGVANRTPPLTREALAKMTAAQITKLDWADIKQVLSQ